MVKCQMIMDAMERIAPKRLAEEWDNPGLLVGSPQQEVHKVYVCLDVSDEVVERAILKGADLIVSHHPLIFRGMKKIRTDLPLGRRLQRLLKEDIAVISAHTNLDIAEGGVNDVLAERIGLEKVEPFAAGKVEEPTLGRMGKLLEPLTLEAFAERVKASLRAPHMRIVKSGNHPIRKVALCSGSGAEFIAKAAFLKADAYVTGDVKYHDAQMAVEQGIHVIDAGHFATEFPMISVLKKRLKEELKERNLMVEILEDTESEDFFQMV